MKITKQLRLWCHMLMGLSLAVIVVHFGFAQPSTPPDEQIRAIAWSPDASQVAIGYHNGRIEIVSLDTPSNVRVLQEPTGISYILALDWSPDGQMLASGSAGYVSVFTVWDINTAKPILTNDRFWVDIISVTWHPDGEQVLVTAAEPRNSAYSSAVINIATGQVQELSLGTTGSVQWSPDRTKIVASHVSNIYVLDADSLVFTAEYPIEQTTFRDNLQNQANEAVWNADGTQVAVGMTDGRIFIFSNENAEQLVLVTTLIAHEYNGHDRLLGFVYALSFTDDNKQLTSISGDGTIRTWDTATWQRIDEAATIANYGAAFTAYGGRAAVGAALDATELSSSETNTVTIISSVANGLVQIIVPAPSLDRLNAIAALCVRDGNTGLSGVQALAQPAASIADLPAYIARVEALPDDAIPPACRADLLAVAGALLAGQ